VPSLESSGSGVSRSRPIILRAPRRPGNTFLELHDGQGHLITAIGRLENFSTTGVCFSSRRAFERGERIYASLRILNEGRLNITGKIVWTKKKPTGYAYGVQFENVETLNP